MGRQVGGKVERAYTGATPLEKPRELMDARGELLQACSRRQRCGAEELGIGPPKAGNRLASRQGSLSPLRLPAAFNLDHGQNGGYRL